MKYQPPKIFIEQGEGASAGWLFIRHRLPNNNVEGIAIRQEQVEDLYKELKPYLENEGRA